MNQRIAMEKFSIEADEETYKINSISTGTEFMLEMNK